MKRLLKIGTVLALLLFVSFPAWAAVNISGQVFFDSYYYHQDKEGFGRAGWTGFKTQPGSGGIAGIRQGTTTDADDRSQTFFDINHSTHLRFHWTNDQGLGAFMVLYINGDPTQSSSTDAGFKVGTSVAVLYYDINKDLRLTAGKGGISGVFSPLSPSTYMGYDGVCKVIALGYGNITGTYANNIRLTYKINKNATVEFALSDPRMMADSDAGFTAKAGTAVDNVTKIPKIEFAVPMTFIGDGFRLTVNPSLMWLRSEFNNVEEGGDNTVDAYGISLGGTLNIGKMEFRAEYNYGQNLYDAARSGIYTNYPFKYEYIVGGLRSITQAKYYAAEKKIYDSETHAFWLQAAYRIGKVKPTLMYGRNDSERDWPSGNYEMTTQFYGVNMPIYIKSNFQVVPEFMVYDNGDDNKLSGVSYDFGKEWLAGVQFRLFF